MGPSRQPRAVTHSRACLNCQKRKSRCMPNEQGVGPCSYCARAGKTCSFGAPPDRTPLTRRNLDIAELRCARLQALLRSLHPELDIESALADLGTGSQSHAAAIAPLDPDEPRSPSPQEQDEPVHEFEWHEASLSVRSDSPDAESNTKDGMATLSSLDAGYLGSSSGSNLLREIASMLPELAATTSSPSNNSQSKSPGRPRKPSNFLDPPGLASSAITGYLIDAYFLFYNVSYPILHEGSFRKRAMTKRARPGKSSWNVIYFMVLAIGHWISTSDAHHARSSYYSAARAALSLHMLESGTLNSIQAFTLVCNYLQKMDRPNTGYNFMGIAYKMALGLGLHREPTDVEDNIGLERRRTLFWVIYCFDSGFNITTGRPPNASEGIIDTRLPRNIEDKDLELNTPIPAEVDSPTHNSAIIAQAKLAKLANSLYHEFLMAKTASTKIDYQVAESIDRALAQWRRGLPQYFTSQEVPMWFIGPRAVVLWKEQNLRIILWRGSKRKHNFLPLKVDAETRCLEAAMQSIHDIAAFCKDYEGILHLGIAWYATYFLFQAALVLEASYLDNKNQPHLDEDTLVWRMVVSKARDCLARLAQKSRPAKRCLEVLDVIHSRTEESCRLEAHNSIPQALEIRAAGEQASNVGVEQTQPVVNEDDFATVTMNDFSMNDQNSDSTMRLILDQTPWGYLDNTPMDALFNDWIYPPFE
ncbi:Regulatory protein GAL4 [Paramyrothecium foliicola]|nr:Regulatory protein GAL4 [Paramyrothecium foliicola]